MAKVFKATKQCKICGKEFRLTSHNQLCCSDECKKINKRQCSKRSYERNSREICEARKAERKQNHQGYHKSMNPNLRGLLLEQEALRRKRVEKELSETSKINRAAREQGLSYGQYVAKLEFQKHQEASIEYMLKSRRAEA